MAEAAKKPDVSELRQIILRELNTILRARKKPGYHGALEEHTENIIRTLAMCAQLGEALRSLAPGRVVSALRKISKAYGEIAKGVTSLGLDVRPLLAVQIVGSPHDLDFLEAKKLEAMAERAKKVALDFDNKPRKKGPRPDLRVDLLAAAFSNAYRIVVGKNPASGTKENLGPFGRFVHCVMEASGLKTPKAETIIELACRPKHSRDRSRSVRSPKLKQ